MNPYQPFVSDYARLSQAGKLLPLGGFPATAAPMLPATAPKALIFSPHPDDECIVGALPLRLLREAGHNVIDVVVTQGSKKSRQAERYQELEQACGYLGFGLIPTAPNGLEGISARTRESDSVLWNKAVGKIAEILAWTGPRIVFLPHEHDWHETHIGTHHLVMDALRTLPGDFRCLVVETEFWGAMANPNLMVESSAVDVADLVAALSFHVGEVKRNPYHLRLPAWMQDNVRRGGELVGGQAVTPPDFTFATLYRLSRWRAGKLETAASRRQFSSTQNPATLFEEKS